MALLPDTLNLGHLYRREDGVLGIWVHDGFVVDYQYAAGSTVVLMSCEEFTRDTMKVARAPLVIPAHAPTAIAVAAHRAVDMPGPLPLRRWYKTAGSKLSPRKRAPGISRFARFVGIILALLLCSLYYSVPEASLEKMCFLAISVAGVWCILFAVRWSSCI